MMYFRYWIGLVGGWLMLMGMQTVSYAATSTTLQNAVAADGNGTAALVPDTGEIGINVSITGKAGVSFETSINSGTTYGALSCRRSGSTAGDVSTTTSSGLFFCHLPGAAYIRTPVVGWQTGTVTVTAYAQGNATGGALVQLDSTFAGEAVADDVLKVEQRGYYTSITTATTTVVKSGPGWFQGCHVLGGTLGNVTIYDNTAASGAVIVAAFTPTSANDLKIVNASFSVGLTVVTAAATNLTCVVR